MGVKNRQYRNQSTLHEWLTQQTYNFLMQRVTGRGLVWRQEHTIHNGMRPDAVAFCSLQERYYNEILGKKYPSSEYIRYELSKRGIFFNQSDVDEYFRVKKEVIDEYYDHILNEFMIVFETKVSYSDFRSSFNGDGQWKERPYANIHFLVCPKDFSKTYDLKGLPDYWGIIEPNPQALKIIKLPKVLKIDRLFYLEAAYTILFKWGKTLNQINHDEINDQLNNTH